MIRLPAVILIALTVGSCAFQQQTRSRSNYAGSYDRDVGAINPSYKIYHIDDQRSQIIFEVHSKDLLYTRKDKTTAFSSEFEVRYIVFDPKKDNYILDSNTTVVRDRDNSKIDKYIVGRIDAQLRSGEEYMVELQARDLNRNSIVPDVLITDKTSLHSPDNFLVTRAADGKIHFNSYVDHSEEIRVQSERNKSSEAFVSVYEQFETFPAPPFSSNGRNSPDLNRDTMFTVKRDSGFVFSLGNRGIYHFATDSTSDDGLALYRFEKGFPKVSSPEAMLHPLRYICTADEYDELRTSEDIRAAVEAFWLKLAGSKERARRLIRIFYKRVEEANKKFTSYNPGWRTDRGLIFVIYGSPDIVRKYKSREVWVYGEEGNAMAISFTFDFKENAFSDNDYQLRRSNMYKSSWYRAVDTWRSGRSYSAR